jgi:hypothetical protein
MAHVIYNGNGSTGGTIPSDSNTYAPNAPFTVQNQGTLGSRRFFYWNTKADGTGAIFFLGPNSFPTQTTDLTLYAVWGVTTGLTNGGFRTHFNFFYDTTVELTHINQVLATGALCKPVIQNDFDWLQAQFKGVDITKGKSFSDPGRGRLQRELGLDAVHERRKKGLDAFALHVHRRSV